MKHAVLFRVCSFIALGIMVVLLGIFGQGCASVPITNRRQLQLVSASEVTQLSATEYNKVLKTNKLSTNRKAVRQLNRVGKRIARATEKFLADKGIKRQFNWEFNLIQEDKQVNAWCMPGGKVAFYTGILPYTRDENGMAVVMGHEVAHAVARHGSERLSQQMVAAVGAAAVAQALKDQSKTTSQLAMAAFGAGATLGILLPYSRVHEYEADHIGLLLTAMAGYDPRTAITFWQRMAEAGKKKNKPPEFLATHPTDAHRIEKLRTYMPQALRLYRQAIAREKLAHYQH